MLFRNKLLKIFVVIILMAVATGFLLSGCGDGEEEQKEAEEAQTEAERMNGKKAVEDKFQEIRDVKNPLFLKETEFLVTAVPEAEEEAEKLEKDYKLYLVEFEPEELGINSVEEISLEISSQFTPFLKVGGDYIFYPVDQGELHVLDRESLEEVEVLGGEQGYHVSSKNKIAYKLPAGDLDTGSEYRLFDLETGEDTELYHGEAEEDLIFTYAGENEGYMYSRLGDNMTIKRLGWDEEDADDGIEVSEEKVIELDYFAESIESGYLPALDEEVIIVAKEAGGGTKVNLYDTNGEMIYEHSFDGFEGELYLSPTGEDLGIITFDKGNYYTYMIEFENLEDITATDAEDQNDIRELPPAQDLSWCPSGDRFLFLTELMDLGIYDLDADTEMMLTK